MSDTETITVADVSAGAGGDDTEPGTTVSLPAVEILTGRGFITGKSGSGKSNTASVVVEKLLASNFPILIVDTDGEYYGLKEEFELLHAGADDECDIQVSPEHAEKLASLALEQNVPIILDVSGYLDESDGKKLLLETAKQLFAKEKKLKKPFLMLVEECHEYIPEGGGLDETGRMLIKIGKRGRKHGLGIVGISQRPADVKKDYITQCDWMVWHRLTWNNDTKVVSRIIDAEHANAVEDLNDGEGFLMTDWSESVRRVQFHRKQTFDAGATPGLDDFERPELKSVSGDLVADLKHISDEQERRASELADMRQELDKRDARIRELERELEEARDLSRMADTFAQAMLQKAEAPYRGGTGRNLQRANSQSELPEDEEPTENAVDDASERDVPPTSTEIANGTTDATDAIENVGSTDAADHQTEPTEESTNGEAAPEDVAAALANVEATLDAQDIEFDHSAFEADALAAFVERLTDRIDGLPDVARGMLRHYRAAGPATPVEAHVAAGGDGDRQMAYGLNRKLRQTGLVRHADAGAYVYALPALVTDAYDDRLGDERLASLVEAVEATYVDLDAEKRDRVEIIEDDEPTKQGYAFVEDDAEVVEEGPPPIAEAEADEIDEAESSTAPDDAEIL